MVQSFQPKCYQCLRQKFLDTTVTWLSTPNQLVQRYDTACHTLYLCLLANPLQCKSHGIFFVRELEVIAGMFGKQILYLHGPIFESNIFHSPGSSLTCTIRVSYGYGCHSTIIAYYYLFCQSAHLSKNQLACAKRGKINTVVSKLVSTSPQPGPHISKHQAINSARSSRVTLPAFRYHEPLLFVRVILLNTQGL